MKKTILVLLLFIPLFFTGCKSTDITNNDICFQTISMEEGFLQMENESNFILLDVRTQLEYNAGHIPGALHLTNESMTEEKAITILPDKSQLIYVYCRSGHRSLLACKKLCSWGYNNIKNIGGILDYKGPIEK